MIIHTPQPQHVSVNMGKQFRSVLPEIIEFVKSKEFEGINGVSMIILISSEFMLATACYLAQEYSEAITFCDLLLSPSQRTLIKQYNRKYTKLFEIIEDMRKSCISSLMFNLINVKDYYNLEKIIILAKRELPDYHILITLGIYEFIIRNDVTKAIKYTLEAQVIQKDIVWKYNLAFLYTCSGKHEEGFRLYFQLYNNYYSDKEELVELLIDFTLKYVSVQQVSN